MKIEIPDELYERLGKQANGFETPAEVIMRILDKYESRNASKRPELIFLPDEAEFKERLICNKLAWKILHFNDGRVQVEEWSATQFNKDSNLRSNIWSGALREWKSKGVLKLILTTENPDENQVLHPTPAIGPLEVQVGKLVKSHIRNIVDFCNADDTHIKLLADKKWCNEHLGISFALVMLTSNITADKLHARFWVPEYSLQGQPYRFCSQFGGNNAVGTRTLSEYHGEKFINYLKRFNLILPMYREKEIKFIVKGIGNS